ncbi:hypothetical protein ACFXJ8_06510 [Nonomuraea sp. NPDC059194]|uniref:hypothetical protein n=1 Tax=Nonomuraea sp. NPDC059194 TaxID=3346764 RepID=UPI0036CBCE1F
MLVVLAIAALAILACVVVVSLGKGGELTEFPPDVPPLGLPEAGQLTAVDFMALQLPVNLVGYHTQSVDETLRRAANAISARDTRIAVLEQRVSELLASRLQARQEVYAGPAAAPRTEHRPDAPTIALPEDDTAAPSLAASPLTTHGGDPIARSGGHEDRQDASPATEQEDVSPGVQHGDTSLPVDHGDVSLDIHHESAGAAARLDEFAADVAPILPSSTDPNSDPSGTGFDLNDAGTDRNGADVDRNGTGESDPETSVSKDLDRLRDGNAEPEKVGRSWGDIGSPAKSDPHRDGTADSEQDRTPDSRNGVAGLPASIGQDREGRS